MATVISDYELTKACDEIAAEIFEEFCANMARDETPDYYEIEMSDRAHEEADGHQWVIYTHYALSICAHCNTDLGEEFVDEVGAPSPFRLARAASMIVYGEMRSRIEARLRELTENWEDDRPEEAEEAEEAEA